ncbi:ATP-dependent helicase [Magnetococcales bacterium HHB-1]
MSAHERLLDGLNDKQREAVTTLDGPVMVLAGAGSGKTRVLTRRLAYLIFSGVYPDAILSVTFTNKAAREMRERAVELLSMCEVPPVRHLWIGTFHGIGARLLREYGHKLGYDQNFIILDSGDQERLLKRLCEELSFKSDYWTPKRLTYSIGGWKDDGLGPDHLTLEHVRYKRDLERVRDMYRRYQDELLKANCMDFGDLLLNSLKIWYAHPEILAQLQQRFPYIMVDEYQDTNAVQYDWIRALSGDNGHLCVVGDDDQSIYSWRGARIENILRFEDDFPQVRVIRLEQNYRSTGNILQAAGGMIENNSGRMEKTLWTQDDDGEPVDLYIAENGEDEARYVADRIAVWCDDDNYDRFAVLVRASRQTRTFEEAFSIAGIPYHLVGGLRFMDRAEVRDAVAYLRLALSDRDDMAFERIYNVPRRGLGASAIQVIREIAAGTGESLLTASRQAAEGTHLRAAARKKMVEFIQLIDSARALSEKEPHAPDKVLNYLIEHSGYLDYLDKEEKSADKKENLNELATMMSRYGDLQVFLEEAALESDFGKSDKDNLQKGVTVSTLHAAKGLEFDTVFLVGLEEDLLPHKLALDEGREGLEEERRLAYVGITRARRKLSLSLARKRWVFRELRRSIPSRFLKEIPQELLRSQRSALKVRRGLGPRSQRFIKRS